MAVYARGYRPYGGAFTGAPGWWVIFREGLGQALRRRGVRWIMIILSFLLLSTAGMLYVQVILEAQASDHVRVTVRQALPERQFMNGYHVLSAVLVSLAAVLVGSGLVADDLRTRGLTLQLVRPLGPLDYVLGKALVLPVLLLPLALLPGILLWLLLGLWQPPGETWAFLAEHADMAWNTLHFYGVGAALLTGLMLTLSSHTTRRGAVMGLAAAVLFGGTFVRGIGFVMGTGFVGRLLRSLDVMNDMYYPFVESRRAAGPGGQLERWREKWAADPQIVIVFAAVLLLFGLLRVWQRARDVEVTA